MKIKGEDKIIVSYYELPFMDNETFERTPNNHLIVDIYNPNLSLDKSVSLDISSAFPDEPYTVPMAKFGTFHFGHQYDISDTIFNNDDDIEFSYIHKHKGMKGNTLYNQYSIAKASQNPIFELSGYGKEGDISGSGFIFDANWKPIKLGIVHEVMNGSMVTKFFNLPLNNGQLSVQEVQKDQLNFYYNHSQQTIGWKDRALQYEIYDMSGRIVKSGDSYFRSFHFCFI